MMAFTLRLGSSSAFIGPWFQNRGPAYSAAAAAREAKNLAGSVRHVLTRRTPIHEVAVAKVFDPNSDAL
jgi:hypothetical protein